MVGMGDSMGSCARVLLGEGYGKCAKVRGRMQTGHHFFFLLFFKTFSSSCSSHLFREFQHHKKKSNIEDVILHIFVTNHRPRLIFLHCLGFSLRINFNYFFFHLSSSQNLSHHQQQQKCRKIIIRNKNVHNTTSSTI